MEKKMESDYREVDHNLEIELEGKIFEGSYKELILCMKDFIFKESRKMKGFTNRNGTLGEPPAKKPKLHDTDVNDNDLLAKWTKSDVPFDFSTTEKAKALDMLDSFPSPYRLVQFSEIVYDNVIKILPHGWLLLIVCRFQSNAYTAAVFFNPQQKQVVVAFRGTVMKRADLQDHLLEFGLEIFGGRVDSAATLACLVCEVIELVDKESNIRFQISFTGHSLGGWLAQYATAASKYLRMAEVCFVRRRSDGHHAHCVAFDSPGFRTLWEEMKRIYDVRCKSVMHLDRIDITVCMSAPNEINMIVPQVGNVLRVVQRFPDENMNHTEMTHPIRTMANAFDPATEELRHDATLKQVIEWPYANKFAALKRLLVNFCSHADKIPIVKHILKVCRDYQIPGLKKLLVNMIPGKEWLSELSYDEFNDFSKHGTYSNNFDPDSNAYLRYQAHELEQDLCDVRLFSEREISLLQDWRILIVNYKQTKLHKLSELVRKYDIREYEDLLRSCQIVGSKIKSISIEKLIKYTKAIGRVLSDEVYEVIEAEMKELPSDILLSASSDTYKNDLRSLLQANVNFKDIFELEQFILANKPGIFLVESCDTQFEMMRIHNILKQLENSATRKAILLNGKFLLKLKNANLENMFKCLSAELLVIEYLDSVRNDSNFSNYLEKADVKKIIFVTANSFTPKVNNEKYKMINKITARKFHFDDLTEDSQKLILKGNSINICGERQSLEQLLKNDKIENLFDCHQLKTLISKNCGEIVVVDKKQDDMKSSVLRREVFETVEKKQFLKLLTQDEFLCQKPIIFAINGIYSEAELFQILEVVDESRKKEINDLVQSKKIVINSSFDELCEENSESRIYLFEADRDEINCRFIYDSGFYVKRKFVHPKIDKKIIGCILLKTGFFFFDGVKNLDDLLTILNAEEFKEDLMTCDNVIFLSKETEATEKELRKQRKPIYTIKYENNQLVLLKSSGLTESVKEQVETIMDESDFKEKAEKAVIISDEPGMGKTTTLTSLSNRMKSSWTIRINVKDNQELIKNLPSVLALEDLVGFLVNFLSDDFTRAAFKYCLVNETVFKIFLLFDGFDEIMEEGNSTKEHKKIMKIFRLLKEETTACVWVTTRDHWSRRLEKELAVLSTKFQKITEEQQKNFLKRVWSSRLILSGFGEQEETKLDELVKHIFQLAKKFIGEEVSDFIGIPLQLTMLAEIVPINSEEDFDIKNVITLYRFFIEKKMSIYKSCLSFSNSVKDREGDYFVKAHQKLGFIFLFPEQKKLFPDILDKYDDAVQLNKIGLVQIREDDKFDFVHQSYGEFFAADLLCKWIVKQDLNRPFLGELLLGEVLLKPKYKLVRVFLNYMLLENLSNEMLNFHAPKIAALFNEKNLFNEAGETFLHVAVNEKLEGIVKFLVGGLKNCAEDFVKLLCALDGLKRNALFLALEKCFDAVKSLLNFRNFFCEDSYEKIVLATFACVKNTRKGERLLFRLCKANACPYLISMSEKCFEHCSQASSLREFISKKDSEKIKETLNKSSGNSRKYLIYGNELLHSATKFEDTTLLEFLLEEDFDEKIVGHFVDSRNKKGETALICAVKNMNAQATKLLLGKGADVNATDGLGHAPIYYVALKKRFDIFSMLENAGAVVSEADAEKVNRFKNGGSKKKSPNKYRPQLTFV